MQKSAYENRVWTIPNVLTAFRILMVPVFVWLYCGLEKRVLAAAALGVSAISDILDGYIARHFHMESNLGRVLDPLADKVMQAAMCLMLLGRYPIMLWVLIFFGVKELALAAMGYAYMKRTGIVNSARWYGKAATAVLFAAVGIHLLWQPGAALSAALIAAAQAGIAGSAALYTARYVRILARGAGYYKCLPADAGKGRSS